MKAGQGRRVEVDQLDRRLRSGYALPLSGMDKPQPLVQNGCLDQRKSWLERSGPVTTTSLAACQDLPPAMGTDPVKKIEAIIKLFKLEDVNEGLAEERGERAL